MNNRAGLENTLKAVLDGIDDIIYVADPETFELLHVNEAFKKNWGEAVLGEKCYRVLQGRDAPCPFCTNEKIFGEYLGKSYVWEFQNEITKKWYRCSDKAIEWTDGRTVRFELASDITEMKTLMRDMSRIFEMSSDMICIADIDKGTFLKVSPAFSKILGYDETDLVGAEFLSFNHPDDVEVTNRVVEEQLKRGQTVLYFENRYRCKDGSYRWLEWVSVPDTEQGLTFAIGRDVSERKRAEAELRDLNERLARSNKELEQFAYVASHDLQEPLRMVASYTQLLAQRYEGQLDEKADKYIGYAVDGARRMQNLINDLLAFSRVGSRGEPLEPTDCGEVVAEVLQSLRSGIEETNAQIVVGDLPTVMADRTQLGQVFQNLISNAIKFHGDRPLRIEVAAELQDGSWELSVADNGIGIEPQFFERVFIIFQRLHARGAYSGSGIGLSIVKKIVERHGGRIRIESAPGQGSRFIFTLRAVDGTQRSDHG